MVLADLVVASLAVSAVVAVGAGIYSLRREPHRGDSALAGLLLSGAVWAVAVVGTTAVADRALAFAFHRLIFLAVAAAAISLFIFALRFGDRRDIVTWRTFVVLLIEPTLFLGFLVTAPDHGLVWSEMTRTTTGTFATTDGPIFWAHVVYSYLLAIAGLTVMLRRAIQARGIALSQFVVVVVALVFPMGTGVFDLVVPGTLNLTPIALTVTGLVLLLATDHYDLLSRTPVVRDALVETVDDAMLVLDGSDDLVDYNASFVDLVGADRPLERPVEDLLAGYPTLRAQVLSRREGIVDIETERGPRYLEVSVSTVRDEPNRRVGDLILLHDVTDQQRQQRELERQNEQLDQFASLISHDLRNPLDVAMGRTTAIGEMADDPAVEEQAEQLQDAHRRMRRIIKDVLTLARQGQRIDDPRPVDLSEVSESAWSHVETDGTDLVVDTGLVVRGDSERLAQVFENLFRNAVEHAVTGDRVGDESVTVRVGDLPDGSGFYVEDDGPGIPADDREHVLEAGYTGDDGTGLGLAIVSTIAEAHGWSVDVTESEAGGARFEFCGVDVVTDDVAVTESGR